MSSYLITVLELDFKKRGVRQLNIRNTLATIHSIVGKDFNEQQVGNHHLLIGEDKALVVRKRDGRWIGIR